MAMEFTVELDMREAQRTTAEFMAAFDRHLETEFRRVLMLMLRQAQSNAPVGSGNYAIEDGRKERRRAGGSRSRHIAKPGGFVKLQGRDSRIRKISGGTLRRALTVEFEMATAQLRAQLGVPSGSPAAKYAEMAERGGTIAAKRVKYLRFSPDGQRIIFKPVVHRAPHPYLVPALTYAWPLVQAAPERAFQAAKAEVGLGE